MISMFGRSEVEILEALKLYDYMKEHLEEKKPELKIAPATLIELDNNGNIKWCEIGLSKAIGNKYGTCRLEIWPEGLVLWVGGEIVWKSWEEENSLINETKKYMENCSKTAYNPKNAFSVISNHFKIIEKLVEYIENNK